MNSVNYENVIIVVIRNETRPLGTPKGNSKVGKQGVLSSYSFEITNSNLHSDLENSISVSVIYMFIRLRNEITDVLH